MQAHTLQAKTKRITSPRVGRGGKRGKTSGRGTKGQNARAGRKKRPEMRDLLKKIPKRRGYGINRSRTVNDSKKAYVAVNLSALDKAFEAGATVTPATLNRAGLVGSRGGRILPVKILGTGTLGKALSISNCAASATAKAAVEAAGGSIL